MSVINLFELILNFDCFGQTFEINFFKMYAVLVTACDSTTNNKALYDLRRLNNYLFRLKVFYLMVSPRWHLVLAMVILIINEHIYICINIENIK